MLVPCTQCSVHYDPAMGRCISCGAEYTPSPEQKREQLQGEVLERVSNGWTLDRAERFLVENGMTNTAANEVIFEVRRELRERAKQHGVHLAASGFALLGIAFLVLTLTGGVLIAVGCFVVGCGTIVIGVVKAFTGWNITGNDERGTATIGETQESDGWYQ